MLEKLKFAFEFLAGLVGYAKDGAVFAWRWSVERIASYPGVTLALWIATLLLALVVATGARGGCLELVEGDVVQVPHGYIIKSLNAFVVHEDALPSGDEAFWICAQAEGPLALYAPIDPMETEPEHGE